MSLDADLVNHAIRDAPLAAEVGRRIAPGYIPQADQLPAIAYSRVETTRGRNQRGRNHLDRIRIQWDCWARTYDKAAFVARLLTEAFDEMTNRTIGTSRIAHITVDGDTSTVAPPEAGREDPIHGVSVVMSLWYREPVRQDSQ